jgi:hypothetical protein
LFGYGTMTERQITEGVRRIGEAIASIRIGRIVA